MDARTQAAERALERLDPEMSGVPAGRVQIVPEIVRRYASGESMQVIAADLGLARSILYRWLLAGLGDQNYAELVTFCLVQRVAEADARLDSAVSVLDIARAREQARYARMDLERRRPGLYGAKPEMTTIVAPVVVITRME